MIQRRNVSSLALLLTLCTTGALAQQQSAFAVDRYRPAERGSRWFSSESMDHSEAQPYVVGATFDWAHRPVTVYDSDGTTIGDVIKNQSILHLGATYRVYDQLRIGVNVPLVLSTTGSSWTVGERVYDAGSGGGLGDVRLGLDYRFFGKRGGPLRVGASVQTFLPTGSSDAYASDKTVRVFPRLLAASDLGVFVGALSVGPDIRGEKTSFAGRSLGSDLNAALSLGVKLAGGKITFGPEAIVATRMAEKQFLKKRGTPAELVIGGHYAITDEFLVGAAAGPGLSTTTARKFSIDPVS